MGMQVLQMVTELTEATFDDFIKNNAVVLIDCWAPWCGPCRRMGPVIEEVAADLAGKVAVAKLNTDENQGISAKLRINAIPTLLVYRNGVAGAHLVGLRPKAEIIAYVMGQ
jgi:thioredoxin 1